MDANAFGVSTSPDHVVNTFNFTVIGTGETELLFPTLAYENPLLGDEYGNAIPSTGISGSFQTIVIPEFPSFFILPSLMATILLATIVFRRKEKQKSQKE